jgi:hypothetical protein
VVTADSFFHSFPRNPELRKAPSSGAILRGILEYGLLLVPEIIKYPHEEHIDGKLRDNIVAVQRRFSVTMIQENALLDHCKIFGPVSIEFSPLSARKLGAMPVIYFPQAAGGDDGVAADKLGFFFAYRLAELQKFLEEFLTLKGVIDQVVGNSNMPIFRRGSRRNASAAESLAKIQELFLALTTRLDSVDTAIGALQGLSKLFYPTDRFKDSVEMVIDPLYYYFQREWRIISDVAVGGVEFDTGLTEGEKEFITATYTDFFNEIITLRSRRARRIDACTIIRSIGGEPVRSLIRSVFAPISWREDIESILADYNMTDRLKTIDTA